MNGQDATTSLLNNINEDTVTITYEEPTEPPGLPDYMVIKVDGYADLGGPSFFPEEHMRDYVAIPRKKGSRQNTDRNTSQKNKQTRLSFHLEGGDSESGFKAQGATHERDEVRVKGFFQRGGLWLVVVSRASSIEHIYIPEGEMPNHLDVRIQRLDTDVIDAETFERELRIQGSVTFRKECGTKVGGKFEHLWTEEQNLIADNIHNLWRKGISEFEDVKNEIHKHVDPYINDALIAKVVRKMQETDENLLNSPVPNLSRDDQKILMQFRDRDKKKTSIQPKFDLKSARKEKKISQLILQSKQMTIQFCTIVSSQIQITEV